MHAFIVSAEHRVCPYSSHDKGWWNFQSEDMDPCFGFGTLLFAFHPHQMFIALFLQTPPNEKGVRVRVLAGPAVNREVASVKHTIPYSARYATEYRRQGHEVEGDGTQRY